MDDTTTTFVGRVATPVESRTLPGGSFKATFRLASSERRLDRATGEWSDGRSLFMTVVAWRNLAQHAAVSLHVGDPVMVHGRIFSREYEKEGRTHSIVEMEASALGPDLTWCTATVSRSSRPDAVAVSTDAGVPAAPAVPTGGAHPDGWDEPIEEEMGADGIGRIEREMQAHEAAVGV